MNAKIVEPCSVRIKKALSIRNMTPAELGAKTKISKSSISEWLSGKHEPKQDKTYILAKALDVDPVWLWGYDVPMEKKETTSGNKNSPTELQLSEGEKKVLELFRRIPEERRGYALDVLEALLKMQQTP